MMNLIGIESDDTVGIKIDGKIRDEDFEAVTSLLEEKIEKHSKVNVYVELESLGAMSPQTVLKDLKFVAKYKNQINKEAIVTEKDWVEKLTSAADKVFNDIDMQTFSFDEKDQAKNWVQN
ncbi:MAG: STAS/SEC14 domain-containing protein [Balneolaceae bacterium]